MGTGYRPAWWFSLAALSCAAVLGFAAAHAAEEKPVADGDRARQLYQKMRDGQELTQDEKDFLARLRRDRQGPQQTKRNRTKGDWLMGRPSIGAKPLLELGTAEPYKGEDGGLYGHGRNTPPEAHLRAALAQAARIQPLDLAGRPSAGGRVALISIGMSNTTREFRRFLDLAAAESARSESLVIVDGAQSGQAASDWTDSFASANAGMPSPWDELAWRLRAAGVSAAQVQIVWIKQAERNPAELGVFPAHARELKEDLAAIVHILKERYPNVRLCYLSSRTYGGYSTGPLSPEPYAYESAFAVRWLIDDQIDEVEALNWDPDRGAVHAPLLLWGPYLWADGVRARESDGLTWQREDFEQDGIHPTDAGATKVADMLLRFFRSDPTATTWFLKKQIAATPAPKSDI